MHTSRAEDSQAKQLLVAAILLFFVHSLSATTYMSVEPVPNEHVVGTENLALIRGIGYNNLEKWSGLYLSQCLAVDSVVAALTAHGAITTVTSNNTRFVVAAGGFEGATNPSYVATVDDVEPGAASMRDVNVLDNALGYVLNQGGTAHFSADNAKAYAFALDYAVVTFDGALTGDEARQFFESLEPIDPALFSGPLAGFTQIFFRNSPLNNSMLFLKPAASKHRFISGLAAAVDGEPRASYSPLKNNGTPTTARAGIAFPGNDWVAFPDGDQYLANIGGSAQLVGELSALRQKHLTAVGNLLQAIRATQVADYLDHGFSCPN
jgi:hypothetical protein